MLLILFRGGPSGPGYALGVPVAYYGLSGVYLECNGDVTAGVILG